MKRALLVAALMTLARVPIAALLDLCPDEAYYWVWSKRLDWSYFDHPPMVAWLIAAATRVFGDSPLAVRLPSLAAAFVVQASLAWTAFLLAPPARKERAAFLTALIAGAVPATHAAAVINTIDSPAAAFWSLTLAFLAAAIFAKKTWGWYAAGVALGCALLSKYTTVTLGGSMALLALFDAETRRALRTPHPWMAAVICIAVFSPVIAWNASHEWGSFKFQLGHGTAREGGASSFGGFVVAQLGILTPMLAALLGVHFLKAGHAETRQGDRFLTAAIAPTALFFAFMAARSRPEANWSALAWLAAAVVGGLAAARFVDSSDSRAHWARGLVGATVVVGAVASIALSVHAVHPLVTMKRDRFVREFHGWKARVDAATAVAGENGVLLGDGYQTASELAYHSGRLDDVGVARRPKDRISMYDFWPQPTIEPNTSAAWLSRREKRKVPKLIVPLFANVEKIPIAPLQGGLWRLDGYVGSGWPPDYETSEKEEQAAR